MSERILIDSGRRTGRKLSAEPAFRAAIAEGRNVVTTINGIYFVVSVGEDDRILYTALADRPEGLDPLQA